MSNIPSRIGGKYRVISLLGRGGSGDVFHCRDENLRSNVAIKLYNKPVAPSALPEFIHEARITNAVREKSAHVPNVIASGDDNGVPYLVFDLLEGCTLSQRVAAKGSLTPNVALEILKQLEDALSAAHQLNIVHRDVKPDNVYIVDDKSTTGGCKAYLLDFGIAQFRAYKEQPSNETTAHGTLEWMAPEQFDSSNPVTPAADQWAFAALAYWLLVGERFPATARGTLSATGAAAKTGKTLAPAFDSWFAKATHNDPTQRFASVKQAVTELEPILKNKSELEKSFTQFAITPPATPFVASGPTLEPPSKTRRSVIILVGALTLFAVLLSMSWLALAPKTTGRPVPIPDPQPIPIQSPQAFVIDWAQRFGVSNTMSELYATGASIHGSSTMDGVRWSELVADRHRRLGSFDITAESIIDEPLDIDGSPAECARAAGSEVRKVHFQAHWNSVDTNRAVPCENIHGTYQLWLTRIADQWKICQESWSRCDALCVSCPQQPSLCAGCNR